MCGIVCALDLKQSSDLLRSQVLEMSKKVRHRGPDGTEFIVEKMFY